MEQFEQADRMKNAPLSRIREIIDLSAKLEREGKPIIHLEIGEPDFDTPQHIIDEGKLALNQQDVHYGPVVGSIEIRDSIAEFYKKTYGLEYVPEETLITHGVAHGLFLAMMAYLNPGDEILVPDPGYLCYFTIPNIAGAKAVSYHLNADNSYQIEEGNIRNLITPKTKAILLNSPSNPCGFLLDRKSLEIAARLAEEYNLLIISDDVYSQMIYDDNKFETIASIPDMRERTIILNGFSKYYAMTGWRIGYIVCDKSLMDPLMRLSFYSISCPNTFVQRAAVSALKEDDRASRKMVAEYQRRRDYMCRELNMLKGCRCDKPSGAFYIFLDIRETGLSSEAFCQLMLNKHFVTMTPGHVFGDNCEGFVRISYANSIENLEIAMKRMNEALETL